MAIEINPEKIIQQYRTNLEASRHQSLLLELYVEDLQTKITDLEGEKSALVNQIETLNQKVEGMAKQLGTSEGLTADQPRGTAE